MESESAAAMPDGRFATRAMPCRQRPGVTRPPTPNSAFLIGRVSQHHLARRTDYAEFIEVVVRTEAGQTRAAGALLDDRHPRVVRIDDYHVDVEPRGSLLIIRNRDVPGVIGKVGTLLGEVRLNIAGYHQARLSEGGDALAAVAVDGRVERDLMARLHEVPEIHDARLAELE